MLISLNEIWKKKSKQIQTSRCRKKSQLEKLSKLPQILTYLLHMF